MMKQNGFTKFRPHLVPMLFLLAVTAAVYGRALGHEFLTNWDDHLYVTGNEAVRGFSPGHLRLAFSRFFVGNYAPLQIISYMADYSLWGMKPAGYLLSNILLHAANGLLFYWIVAKLTGQRLWAFVAAFFFLFHPVQVESVAWISQRKNLLAMLFFLIALLLYGEYAGKGRQEGRLTYAGSLAAFVLALLAKSVAVVLPPALILYDFCFLERGEWKRRLSDKLPYALVAGAVAILAVISQGPEYHGGRTVYHGGSPWATLLTMLPVLVRYLAMLVWPTKLSAVYDPPIKTGFDAAVGGALVAIVLTVIVGVLLHRWGRGRVLFFGYCLFFLGLAPVSQVVPLVTLMNDRYLYFPMLGAAMVVGGLVTLCLGLNRIKGQALVGVICIPLVLLPWLASARVAVWRDSVALWIDAAEKTPGRKDVWKALGESFDKSGRHRQALAPYLQALAIDPNYCEVLNNVGVLYLRDNDLASARGYLERVVRQCPAYGEGFQNLGHCYYNEGKVDVAEAAYRQALKLEPTSAPTLIAMGNIGLKKGDLLAARSFFSQAHSVSGDTAEIAYNMACLEALSGRADEALRQLELAFRLGFTYVDMMKKDPYLASIRTRTEFARLLSYPVGRGNRRL